MSLCTNHGRYCANDPDDDLYAGVSGADVVTESLRRICIWSHYGEGDGIGLPWWNYVEQFMERCNDPDYFASDDCILDVYKHSDIDKAKIDDCIRNSGGLEADSVNNKLDSEIKVQREKGVVLVPTSFVNGAKVKGATSSSNIFEAICAGYSEGTKPEICYTCGSCPQAKDCILNGGVCFYSTTNSISRIDGRVSTNTFASSMLLLICLFGGASYWYYQRTRDEMREQVRGILAEYMPLEDSEDGGVGGSVGGNFMMSRSAPPSMGQQQQSQLGGSSYMMNHHQQPDTSAMSFAGASAVQSGYSAPTTHGDPMRSSLMSS